MKKQADTAPEATASLARIEFKAERERADRYRDAAWHRRQSLSDFLRDAGDALASEVLATAKTA